MSPTSDLPTSVLFVEQEAVRQKLLISIKRLDYIRAFLFGANTSKPDITEPKEGEAMGFIGRAIFHNEQIQFRQLDLDNILTDLENRLFGGKPEGFGEDPAPKPFTGKTMPRAESEID